MRPSFNLKFIFLRKAGPETERREELLFRLFQPALSERSDFDFFFIF